MDKISEYTIKRYTDSCADLIDALTLIHRSYNAITDLSGNSIELFAARDYMETCGFINRMQTLCARRIQAIQEANNGGLSSKENTGGDTTGNAQTD